MSTSLSLHWEEKNKTRILSEQGAFEALPKSTREPVASCSKESLTSKRMWSPDLEHSAHIHEALGAGMCTTTLHAITKTEPASRLHAEVITEYLVFLRDNPLQIKRIERAWQLLLRRFEGTAGNGDGFTSRVSS